MAHRTVNSSSTSDFERHVVAFAEQLGSMVGAAQAKTEGWLAHTPLREHLVHIRDRASELLAYIDGEAAATGNPPNANMNRSRAAASPDPTVNEIHAPRKRHRRPARARSSVPHSNEQVAKAKITSMRRSRGRG